jgi:hypothetical protein
LLAHVEAASSAEGPRTLALDAAAIEAFAQRFSATTMAAGGGSVIRDARARCVEQMSCPRDE